METSSVRATLKTRDKLINTIETLLFRGWFDTHRSSCWSLSRRY